METLNLTGAGITVLLGCLGLFFPQRAAAFTGLTAVTIPGRSEFRSTFGGLFLFAGMAPLVTSLPATYLVLGLSWAGAATGRIASIFADNANSPKNWAAVAFEGAIATLLLVGDPFALLLETMDRL
jgi:hypothetical protein